MTGDLSLDLVGKLSKIMLEGLPLPRLLSDAFCKQSLKHPYTTVKFPEKMLRISYL